MKIMKINNTGTAQNLDHEGRTSLRQRQPRAIQNEDHEVDKIGTAQNPDQNKLGRQEHPRMKIMKINNTGRQGGSVLQEHPRMKIMKINNTGRQDGSGIQEQDRPKKLGRPRILSMKETGCDPQEGRP